MLRAGLVSVDHENKWIGGRYYLHHLVRCVARSALPTGVELREVRWGREAAGDPFAEVRGLVGSPVIVEPPADWPGRIARKVRNLASGSRDARDLFAAQGIDVLFPIPPCANPGTPYVFWLPDFQYARRPDLMTPEMRSEMERYFREHVRTAARIVLSSEDARSDFASIFPGDLERTHVVRFCSVPDEEWWQLDPAATATAHGLPERFFIVCNQFTRHKNHLTLVDALALLAHRGHRDIHLACTGSTFDHRQENYIGQVRAELAAKGLASQVHLLGLIPRNEQIALVRRAVAVLQPSSFEGWSTIIEDARTLGKIVLASDLPVHREQLGPAHAPYLAPTDAQAWADAMESCWTRAAPGPDPLAESAGVARLADNMAACAHAFADALHKGASSR